MVSPPITPTTVGVVAYCVVDLDEFAAALADLASAIARRDSADAHAALERVTAIDPNIEYPLADFLTFTGMFEEV